MSETHFLVEHSILCVESRVSIVISIFVTVVFDGRCLVSKQRMSRKPDAFSLMWMMRTRKPYLLGFLFGLFARVPNVSCVCIGL